MGITTYLKRKMQGATPFRLDMGRRHPSTARSDVHHDQGMRFGRYTDHLFRRVISRQERLDPNNRRHVNLLKVFELLRMHRISIKHTQVPVYDQELDVRTTLDGLGVCPRGICVFELKTTTYTLNEHLARYVTKCSNRPFLHNHRPNTEKSMHALQTAFGVLCCRARTEAPVIGVVVVACTDGAKLYYTDSALASREVFRAPASSAHSQAGTVRRQRRQRFLTLPAPGAQAYRELEAAMRHHGYNKLVTSTVSGMCCSGIARGDGKHRPIAVIGLLGATTADSTRRRHLRLLRQDALKLHVKHKKKCPVRCYLVYPGGEEGFQVVAVGKPLEREE
jgi:hypothetical protein